MAHSTTKGTFRVQRHTKTKMATDEIGIHQKNTKGVKGGFVRAEREQDDDFMRTNSGGLAVNVLL